MRVVRVSKGKICINLFSSLTTVASYPGSQLIKCVGEEKSLVSTALRFKRDSRHSSGSGFHLTLSHHTRMDDIISCQVSIKSF